MGQDALRSSTGTTHPWGLTNLMGAIPVPDRGPAHTAPTYIRRSRDKPFPSVAWSSHLGLRQLMTNFAALKNTIRTECLKTRNALPIEMRLEASMDLAKHADMIQAMGGNIVSGFWPIRSEMDTRPLLFALRERGLKLCLPVVMSKTEIIFRAFEREAPLMETGFGTYGPTEEAETMDPDILLVPLSAFDAKGDRIGYGAGFYDRAIAKLQAKGRSPKLVGVAFDCQEVPEVPTEPHDKPLEAVLTESGLRQFSESEA